MNKKTVSLKKKQKKLSKNESRSKKYKEIINKFRSSDPFRIKKV